MKWGNHKSKQLLIYILIAYGVTYLMGLLMWFGYERGISLYLFPNAQMMYPAAGVMLAYLLTEKENMLIPKRFFITFLVLTALAVASAIGSVLFPGDLLMGGSIWMVLIQLLIIIGSILCWIMLLTERKEKREAFGLKWKRGKTSWCMIILFFVLYLLRTAVSYGLSGEIGILGEIAANPNTWIMLVSLAVNFFLVFIAFFGEEYGWRYYLQPILQEKFGKRWGVLLLGVVWGLWHLPVNFFYYSPGTGLASAAAQQITCITLGIFFAYAYMKTENIWVPVILHFMNNNLIPIISGTYSASVIENQTTTWASLIPALIINGIIFGGFLFAKVFRKEER